MKMLNDATALKLHFEKDKIWYFQGQGCLKQTMQTPIEFFDSKLVRTSPTVRLIGSRINAGHIVELYKLQEAGNMRCVQICSPICVAAKYRKSPDHVILGLRTFDTKASSVGGFHTLTPDDFHQYKLIREVFAMRALDEKTCRNLLQYHPAYLGASFISHLDLIHLCQLLAIIIDPRWYIDETKPDKSSKLESYLGLIPKTMKGLCGDGPEFGSSTKCRIVLNTWFTDKFKLTNIEEPQNFLKRIYKHYGEGSVASLRASQYFISFLRLSWLQQMHCINDGRESLFVPQYFFKNSDEANAYKSHCVQYSRKYIRHNFG